MGNILRGIKMAIDWQEVGQWYWDRPLIVAGFGLAVVIIVIIKHAFLIWVGRKSKEWW